MTVTIVVGNPKPQSRTFHAAELVAERLTGEPPDERIDLVELGAGLRDRSDPRAAAAKTTVVGSDLVVVATRPTRAPIPACSNCSSTGSARGSWPASPRCL